MALVGKSLNEVSVVGAGAAVLFVDPETFFDVPKSDFTLQIVTTGAPTFSVDLEGTVDGVNWVTVFSLSADGFNNRSGFPLVAARANLTLISGGSSPTVTAWIAAA